MSATRRAAHTTHTFTFTASGDLKSSNCVLFAFATLVMCFAIVRFANSNTNRFTNTNPRTLHAYAWMRERIGRFRSCPSRYFVFKCVYENAIKTSDGLRWCWCYWCYFSCPCPCCCMPYSKIRFVPFYLNSFWQLNIMYISRLPSPPLSLSLPLPHLLALYFYVLLTNKTISNGFMLNICRGRILAGGHGWRIFQYAKRLMWRSLSCFISKSARTGSNSINMLNFQFSSLAVMSKRQ